MAHEENGPTWRLVAIGAITLVFSVTSYLVGSVISNISDKLDRFQQTLDARASLPPRVETLEKQHGIYEQRLREMEQWQWHNSPKQ